LDPNYFDWSIRYDNQTLNSNQFNVAEFIVNLDDCMFNELDIILDIGSFLSTIEDHHMLLYHYLYERFHYFVDADYEEEAEANDCFVQDFIEDLNQEFNEIKSKKEKLFELFTLANYMIHDEFNWALDFRLKRFHEGPTDDEYYEGEDFDF